MSGTESDSDCKGERVRVCACVTVSVSVSDGKHWLDTKEIRRSLMWTRKMSYDG